MGKFDQAIISKFQIQQKCEKLQQGKTLCEANKLDQRKMENYTN